MPLRRGRRLRARPRPEAAMALAVALLTGCTPGSDPADQAAATAAPSSAHLDLRDVLVPRGEFCHLLDGDDVTQALGGPVTATDHYQNGDEAEVRPGLVDVVHEYGCVYESADGTLARAWVFARPVDPADARELVRRARRGRDCAFPASVDFGSPTLTSVCEVSGPGRGAPSRVRARLQGLFGDSWVGCEVSEPLPPPGQEPAQGRADVVQRADQWCTDVVAAVAAEA